MERELELGADAVGARHQHRFLVFLRHFKKGAESADAGQYTVAQRAFGEGLDIVDKLIAGVDVDTGVTIGRRIESGAIGLQVELPGSSG